MSDLRRIVATLVVPLLLLAGARVAHASRELVQNPLLTNGKDGVPLQWKSEGYRMEPQVTTFGWTVDPVGLGVVEIDSKIPNDARWEQTIPVSPDTWYRVSGWVRSENVGGKQMGGHLSVMGTFNNSRDLRGTIGWQPVGFWMKTDGLTTKLQIACRLGGYSSLNTGKVWCTGISVVAGGTPEPDRYVYGSTAPAQVSSAAFGVQAIAVLVVIGVALLVWRYVLPPSTHIPE